MRYATLPLALFYGVIIWLRNKMYDSGWADSLTFNLPIINMGNLSVGGTGKTPHTAYLIELLSNEYNTSTLSRGYGRRTRGFKLATTESEVWEVGDEPLFFKQQYPHITVCVCEDRVIAVPTLKGQLPNLQLILLDDALQHRSIKPSLNILITDYNRLYTKDYILPFGLLREFRSGARRANIIMVSKSPSNLTIDDSQKILKELKPEPHQEVFFSTINYQGPINLFTKQQHPLKNCNVLLLTAIANNNAITSYLSSNNINYHLLPFKDHHYFTQDDIKEAHEIINNWNVPNKVILTTAKDATKLVAFKELIQSHHTPFLVLPITISILFEAEKFNNIIREHVANYYPVTTKEEIEHEEEDN